jgi:hypothetical protein
LRQPRFHLKFDLLLSTADENSIKKGKRTEIDNGWEPQLELQWLHHEVNKRFISKTSYTPVVCTSKNYGSRIWFCFPLWGSHRSTIWLKFAVILIAFTVYVLDFFVVLCCILLFLSISSFLEFIIIILAVEDS